MELNNQDDRLSKLPDHIVVKILDQVNNARDVVRASILSRRWRYLPTMLSRLVIRVDHFLPKGVFEPSADEVACTNAAIVEAMKSLLSKSDSNGYSIELLHMAFYLRGDDSISIGHAVGHTMARQNIETAEFIILTEKSGIKCNYDDSADYGRQFMSLFTACPKAFGGLTRLHLENLSFGEMDVANVLSTCRRLRHLHLYNCDSGDWTMLQVVHSDLNVLSIISSGFEKVELKWLPKLTTLTFEGWSFEDPLSFGYVPVLKSVSLSNPSLSCYKMVVLSKFLTSISVRDLTLDFQSEKIWVQPEAPKGLVSVFQKLCSVNLLDLPEGYDLMWTLFILEAAPSLKELYLTVWDHLCTMITDEEWRTYSDSEKKGVEWKATDFKHQSLTKLTIFNFQTEDYFVSYVRRVMEAAINLEDVFLHNRIACRMCRGKYPRPSKYPYTKEQIRSWRKKIGQGTGSLAMIHFPAVIPADHIARTHRL